jgi:hypothetical protein
MLLIVLIVVSALVIWALRLMEQAFKSQEFSFMLAGFLVASSAVAMISVYFLMNNYVAYMDQTISTVPSNVSVFYSSDSRIMLQSPE